MNAKPDSLLEQRLRSERPRFSLRAGFTERVMENLPVRTFERASFRPQNPWLRFAIAFGAAAAITLVVSQIVLHRGPFSDGPSVAQAEQETDPSNALKLPEISIAQMQELSSKLDQPLQTELKNVISDTRQAIQFVASNFLPDRPEN